jgi:hypothetical protein
MRTTNERCSASTRHLLNKARISNSSGVWVEPPLQASYAFLRLDVFQFVREIRIFLA